MPVCSASVLHPWVKRSPNITSSPIPSPPILPTPSPAVNHGMTFCYISGAGTDSTEKGKLMWARVKGKTENDLMKMSFKGVYNFRPGFIKPFLPLKPNQTFYKTYKFVSWLFPVLKFVCSQHGYHTQRIGGRHDQCMPERISKEYS